jgi:hypothetical protein
MPGIVSALKDAAMRPVQAALSRIARDVVALLAIGILALITVVFMLATLYVWFEQMWGPLVATGAMAVLFLVFTLVAVGIRASTAATRRKDHDKDNETKAATRQSLGMAIVVGDQIARIAGIVGARKRSMPSAAREGVRRANPWVLVAVAVLSGFVGGRMLDRD